MKIYKIKSQEELLKNHFYFDDSIWETPEMYDLRMSYPEGSFYDKDITQELENYAKKINRDIKDLRFGVIDDDDHIYGEIISSKYSKFLSPGDDEFEDDEFEIIFGWAKEYEITRESHPEYFL